MLEILSDKDFEDFRDLIYDESGITFTQTNRSILDSRIKELLRLKNIRTPMEYFSLVISNTEELKLMLDAVTTNLTRFFRNQPHFDSLVNYVVPHVIQEKKEKGLEKNIKIWSAGCSTGEEPYTIAMLMQEVCPPDFKFTITASDISLKSLLVGQKGFYTDIKVDGIPQNYLEKYFTKVSGGYQVKKELMDTIHFDYHNLKHDSGSRNIDILFCRNVLIYFDEPAQKAVIDRFYNSMAKHSYLYIGHSESLFGMNTKFEFLKTTWACLYQKNEKN